MAISQDSKSFLAVQWGGAGSYVILPAGPGGLNANDPSGVMPVFLVGNAAFEGVNWYRTLWQPATQWSGIPHRYWFNKANLRRMFGGVQDAGGRSGSTGFLGSTGALAYRIGSGVVADEKSGVFTSCYASGLTLSGGGQGQPISAAIGFMGCGAISGTSIATVAGAADYGAIELGDVGCFLSDGVNFSASVDQLEGWSLTILNGLGPDLPIPASTISLDATVKKLVQNYLSGPLGAGLTLFQRAGSANPLTSANPDAILQLTITLQSIESNPANIVTVAFNFQGTIPTDSSGVRQVAPTLIARTYMGQATFSGGTLVSKLTIGGTP